MPGFRGLAYIVFNDFQLEKYGNRIPNFRFEVYSGTPTRVRDLQRRATCTRGLDGHATIRATRSTRIEYAGDGTSSFNDWQSSADCARSQTRS